MRRFLLLFATVFLSVAAFAAEELKYECLFGSSYNNKNVNDYTSTWKTTNDEGKTWTIVYFNNANNAWSYVKCGSKSAASVASVTTDFACTEAISKVTITIDAVTTSYVNSITLYSSTTSDFTSKETLGTFKVAKGEQSVTIKTPTAGRYYMVEFNMKSGKTGALQLSKVSYYSDGTGGGGTGTTVSAPTITANYNQVSLACETEGAKIYYTTDGTTEPTAESTEYTAPFTISAPTTVKAIAITSEGSSSVTTKACDYYITSMSEFNSIVDATGYKVHLTNATVAYQDGDKKRIFLFDGENGILIFSNTALATTYNPGDVIATVDGDFTIYNNLPEITNATLGEKTEGTAPTPVEATFADFTYANSNKYVIIKNVTFNKRAKTATFSDGKELTVFSSNGMTHPGNGVYNIIGFVNIFKGTTIEIDAIEFVAKSLSFSTNSVTMTYGDAIPEFKLENPAEVALTWSSSDDKVATVDTDGKVTVVGVGATTIKAAETGNESNYAELTFTVSPAAGNISYFANKFVVLKGAKFVAPVLTNPNGLTVTYDSKSENILVDENTGEILIFDTSVADVTATITATAAAQGNYAESIASYTIVVKEAGSGSGTGETYTDVLTLSSFGIADQTDKTPNYKVGTPFTSETSQTYYVGNMAGNFNSIQLRSKQNGDNTYSGIVASNAELMLRKVTIEWKSNTPKDRTLDIFGNTSAYSSADDLYATETKGTKIGSIVCGTSTTLDITGDYHYIGLRSNADAIYITSITLEWEGAAAGAPTFSATLSISKATEGGESANVLSLSEINGTVELAGKNVYLNDRKICGADASATYLPYLADGVFTVVDGTTAYALNATLPDLSAITAKVKSVQYFAYQDKAHELGTGKWILEAEYTFELDGEYKYEFGLEGLTSDNKDLASDNNKIKLNDVGTFEVVGSGKEATLKYTTMASCNFVIQPVFPFFVKSGMSDMIKVPEGTSRIVAINGTVAMVEVDKLAEQPSAEGGNVSGVESVVVDSEGAVEYYNLQGVRVEGALTPGIYIRRTATGTSKVAIR